MTHAAEQLLEQATRLDRAAGRPGRRRGRLWPVRQRGSRILPVLVMVSWCALLAYGAWRAGLDEFRRRPVTATLLLLVSLVYPAVAWETRPRGRWRRSTWPANPSACTRCGYDLTGNRSGACPECGHDRYRDVTRWR